MPGSFIVGMILLSILATAFLLVPILRSGVSSNTERIAPAAFAVLLGLCAFGVYSVNSEWNWRENGVPENPAVEQLYTLQKAVNEAPADATAWRKLGLFYLQFEQADGALDALNKAVQLSGGRDPESNLLLVDALSLNPNAGTQMRAIELINATLKVAPDNRKALWYGGELSFAQGNLDTAIVRWQELLALTKKSSTSEAQAVARMLSERISAAKLQLSQPPVNPQVTSQSPDTAVQPETVSATVTLAPKWQASTDQNSTVFVLARSVGQPGPPLAVQRLQVGDLPVQITLSDDDAMLPTRKISDFKQIEIVARVALGGSPQAQPGDYFGSVKIGPDDNRVVSIVMDSIQP